MRRITVASLLLLSMLMSPAGADSSSTTDPDDTSGRLDIRRLAHGHDGEVNLRHRLRMSNDWSNRALSGIGTEIYIWFSTDTDEYAELRGVIDRHEGRLYAEMEKYDEAEGSADIQSLARIEVTRPSSRAVEISFPRSLLGASTTHYYWSATAYFISSRISACHEGCQDIAPETGSGRQRILHVLGP